MLVERQAAILDHPGPKPCRGCGGPKDAKKGAAYCAGCRVERKGPRGCERCGGPKPPGMGRRLCETCVPVVSKRKRRPCRKCGDLGPKNAPHSTLCPDCAAIAAEVAPIKRRNRAALRRKPCRDCGGPKGPGRTLYCPRCKAQRAEEAARCKQCNKNPRRAPAAKLCERCFADGQRRTRARITRWRLAKYRADPVRFREYRRKWERERKKVITVEQLTREAEIRRIDYRIKARAEGRAVRQVTATFYSDSTASYESLPSEPLVFALLARSIATGESLDRLAAQSGVPARTFRRWRETGEGVRAAKLDEILQALDLLWWEVYDPALRPGLFSARRSADVVAWLETAMRAAELFGDTKEIAA